uniref:SET domain-containing protein n=1 Tax=Psilocybe cubensis TaxID=181762 RepID=A0A8H7Y1I2_PSICU
MTLGFKLQEMVAKKSDALKTDYSKDAIVVTTIPSVIYGDPPDPDGNSEWIVMGPTKQLVLKAPGYPRAVPKTTGLPAYEVRLTQDMGFGIFATRDIEVGELIFAERPLLVMPVNFKLLAADVPLPDNFEDIHATQMAILLQSEKVIEYAVARMTPGNQEAFKALANMHTEDGSGPLAGIVRTNGYLIDSLYDGEKLVDPQQNGYIGFRASRDIEAGEQLFYGYCDDALTAVERKAKLARYAVVCSCAACIHATPQTDRLRQEYEGLIDGLHNHLKTFPEDKTFDNSALERLLEIQKMLIKEGLHGTKKYGLFLGVLSRLYLKLGQYDKAEVCLKKLKGYHNLSYVD